MSETKSTSIQKIREGVVVSSKADKTIVVAFDRVQQHPKYKKYITRRKKYYAHDEGNQCNIGDRVRIVETRPLSKMKRWRVESILTRAK